MTTRLQNCREIELPAVSHPSGQLAFIEAEQHVPFAVRRVYYIYDVPDGSRRGAHAHRALHQFIVAVSGSFEVILDDGTARRSCRLSRPDRGLYVCPMMWRELQVFSPGAVCLVLASAHFSEADYIRDYAEYLRALREGR